MKNVEEIVDDAIYALGLQTSQFRKMTKNEAVVVLNIVERTFIDSSIDGRVWWNRLTGVDRRFDEPEAVRLGSVSSLVPCPTDEVVYFIPDRDDGVTNPVYVVTSPYIDRILQETYPYEYYIVASDHSWLLAVTDHCQVIVCKQPPAKK